MKIPMFKSTRLGANRNGFFFQRKTPDKWAIAIFVVGQTLLVLAIEEVRYRRQLRLQESEVLSLDDVDEPDAEPIDEDESS